MEAAGMNPQPTAPADYAMTCRHCGGAFLEMVDLLFHQCAGQPARRTMSIISHGQPAKRRKVRLNANGKGAP